MKAGKSFSVIIRKVALKYSSHFPFADSIEALHMRSWVGIVGEVSSIADFGSSLSDAAMQNVRRQ